MNLARFGFATSRFNYFPIVWLVLCFIAGILLSAQIRIGWYVPIAACLVFVLLTIFFLKKSISQIFLLAAFVFLGAFVCEIEKLSVRADRLKVLFDSGELISNAQFEISGISEGRAESAAGGYFLRLQTENISAGESVRNASGRVRIFVPTANEADRQKFYEKSPSYADTIKAFCKLRREERFLNPGMISTKAVLDGQEIDATCTVKSPDWFETARTETNFSPLGFIYDLRGKLIDEFREKFSGQTAGILIASLTGNRYFLDKATAQSFRQGGTFHILVISGLQITFIGGLAILFLRLFTKNKFWQFVWASLFLWSYTIAVGADAPVTRAALMFTVLHLSFVIYRQANLLNTLALSALVLLAWKPSELFNQSFQLTFVCVAALVATAFPLIEKLRAVGNWKPSAETPVPPACSPRLKSFCEILYWSEKNWQAEQSRNIWKCKIFKDRRAARLENLRLQKILRYVFETLTASFIVQLWLIPLSILYFHRISLISVFLNVWVGALSAIESLTAVAGIFIAQVSDIFAAPFIWLTEILTGLILTLTVFFADYNWSNLRIPHYAGAGKIFYVLYPVPLVVWTMFIQKWKPLTLRKNAKHSVVQAVEKKIVSRRILKCAGVLFVIFFGIIIFHPFSEPAAENKLRLDFLDVGQGDSIFVTMPTGETLLIDGGGRPNFNKIYLNREGFEPESFEPDVQNIGETVVSNFLWERGYSRADYILATHADTDHIQGLSDIAANFSVKHAIVGQMPFQDEDFADFYETLKKKSVPLSTVSSGDVLTFGNVQIEILYPAENLPANLSENNKSIVLRIIYGDTKILLSGDIEKEVEERLLETPELLRADVVKVAHHGSKTSSTENFIKAAKAKLAVISVGRESPYGHPNPQIVERWRASGAKVMTTGEKGTITLKSDGKLLSIVTFTK